MIKLIPVIILVAFVSCQNSSNSADKKINTGKINQATLSTAEFKISGMTCIGCENTIKSNIQKMDGIQSVTVSHTAANAIVVYDSTKITMPKIAEAINNSGYKTESFNKK